MCSAISSAERIPSLDVPTLREQGVDVEFESWRVAVRSAWRVRSSTASVSRQPSKRWRDRPHGETPSHAIDGTIAFSQGPAFVRFLEADEARVRAVFRKLGTGATEASRRRARIRWSSSSDWFRWSLAFAIGARRSRRLVIEPAGAGWRAVMLVAAGIMVDLALMEYLGFVLASIGLFWLTARAFDAAAPSARRSIAPWRCRSPPTSSSRASWICRCPPGVLAGLLYGAPLDGDAVTLLWQGLANALTLPHLAWSFAGVTTGHRCRACCRASVRP